MVSQQADIAMEWGGDRIKSKLEELRLSLLPGAEPEAAFRAQMLLADSQWLDKDEMQEYQLEHLKALVPFAAREIPFWRSRLAPDALDGAQSLSEALSRLPILARASVHDEAEAMRAKRLPKGQEPAGTASTSGSTGMTVRVATTKLDVKWQTVLDLRRYLWAGLDLRKSVASIQRLPRGMADYPEGSRHDRWAPPSAIPFPTGPSFQLATHASLEQQWEWLKRTRPAYLDTMPSLIRGYAHIAEDNAQPGLERILTTGEVVDAPLRTLAEKRLGAKIHDKYSTQEAGCMAIQCPDCDAYHVQSEAVILEVLDDAGKPCKPGEIGRVVVTPLFNFAMPLLRYDIGDFAEVGEACSCGRSLPTLSRIMGRRRNVLVAPDGKHYWPTLDSFEFFYIAQSREHQFRQVAPNVLEIWLVVNSPRTSEQEEAMRNIVAAAMPCPFEIRLRYVTEFPRGPSGKHEEFISFVSDPPRNASAG